MERFSLWLLWHQRQESNERRTQRIERILLNWEKERETMMRVKVKKKWRKWSVDKKLLEKEVGQKWKQEREEVSYFSILIFIFSSLSWVLCPLFWCLFFNECLWCPSSSLMMMRLIIPLFLLLSSPPLIHFMISVLLSFSRHTLHEHHPFTFCIFSSWHFHVLWRKQSTG